MSIENFEDLNEICLKKEQIVIKIHPQFEKCTNEIKKYFKSLTFQVIELINYLKCFITYNSIIRYYRRWFKFSSSSNFI